MRKVLFHPSSSFFLSSYWENKLVSQYQYAKMIFLMVEIIFKLIRLDQIITDI